ncbi:uncharacterized protein BP5553_07682 [Venustampulla echinocandica]|uniref:Mnd1 HTH domain-containing protein n=1 Tax=Venustampulla echinocandica TaxID=2656787 RepID=A0A370TH84_9HELO|nr:uncharacterized protein BP5553_07682 [Venustampulla echinocandica]RDL34554.1 hypothetical protein BP5553_07682 [Venustampulla echinocandica]
MLNAPAINRLGQDPGRAHRINANSFQQNAITTVKGWQYVAFYTEDKGDPSNGCYVNLARRKVGPLGLRREEEGWEVLTFEDYKQVVDDGHNTISIGVCRGDGTIHIAFDHHCDKLRFRISNPGEDIGGGNCSWTVSQFTKTQSFLPGVAPSDFTKEVTYPRFVNMDDNLLLTYRIGQAGEGSDVLYRYSSETHSYTFLGQYLTGVSNNPYVNGVDYRMGMLHVSWCYRNFVSFSESASPNAHKQQAGPNGPENNFDLNYAFSDDLGRSWKCSDGGTMAGIGDGETFGGQNTIMPSADGARVFEIPMGSGILNQEAQTADWEGGFWALNREKINNEQRWILYYRDASAKWTKKLVPHVSQPTETGSRAKICVDRNSNVYVILPGNLDTSLSIFRGRKDEGYDNFELIWTDDGYDGEPLVDVQRLEGTWVASASNATFPKTTSALQTQTETHVWQDTRTSKKKAHAMAPKNLPPAAKQARILDWFRESMSVYTLKELEKSLQSVASINQMQVKDYLQALQDENLIRVEKIGSGNWYWCFMSDAKKTKENMINTLKGEESKLVASITDTERQIQEEMTKRKKDYEMPENNGMDRKALLEAHETLLRETEMLDKELACYSDNDPAEILRKIEETKTMRDRAMRWTDNIEAIESFIANLTGDRARAAELMQSTCGDEYVVGEGLKDLCFTA